MAREQEAELQRLREAAQKEGREPPAALNEAQAAMIKSKLIDLHVKKEKLAVFQVRRIKGKGGMVWVVWLGGWLWLGMV